MNNAQINESNINSKNKKRRHKKGWIFLGVLGFCILVIIINRYVYVSFEFKSEDQIKNLLETYMKDEYNTDVKLTLKEKNSINECLFWLDDCWFSGKSINAYEYKYIGIDKKNRDFVINYANGYFGNGLYHKSKITENYKNYNKKQNIDIEQLLKEHYDTFNIYINLSDEQYYYNEMVVLIYALENNINNLVGINNKISSINSNTKIIYTNDIEAYNLMLNDNSDLFKTSYAWRDSNLLTQKLKYNEIKLEASKENLKLDENNFAIVIINTGSIINGTYYIYQK